MGKTVFQFNSLDKTDWTFWRPSLPVRVDRDVAFLLADT